MNGDSGSLTKRQVEILRLLAKGYDNNQIALSLSISSKTVKNHVSSVQHAAGAGPARTRAVLRGL